MREGCNSLGRNEDIRDVAVPEGWVERLVFEPRNPPVRAGPPLAWYWVPQLEDSPIHPPFLEGDPTRRFPTSALSPSGHSRGARTLHLLEQRQHGEGLVEEGQKLVRPDTTVGAVVNHPVAC